MHVQEAKPLPSPHLSKSESDDTLEMRTSGKTYKQIADKTKKPANLVQAAFKDIVDKAIAKITPSSLVAVEVKKMSPLTMAQLQLMLRLQVQGLS